MTILSTIADGSRKVFSIPPYTGTPTVKVNGTTVAWTAKGDFMIELAAIPNAGAFLDIDYQGIDPNQKVRYVTASRTLTVLDNGYTLDCAVGVELTIPPGLTNFGFAARPAGVIVKCGSGVTTNGTNTDKTTTSRVSAVNPTAAQDAYDLVGTA